MGDFPPLPSGYNPYLGGHSGAAGSIVNAMRAAAAQQQQLQAQQKAQSMKDELAFRYKALKDGFEEVLPDAQTSDPTKDINAPVKPGPMRVNQSDEAPTGPLLETPWGKFTYKGKAKPDATPQQTFSDQRSLLEAGAVPLDKNGNLPTVGMGPYQITAGLPPGHTVTPPGSEQAYAPQPQGELKNRLEQAAEAAKSGTHHLDTERFTDADGNVVPLLIDTKTGKSTKVELPEGITHADKAGKRTTYRYEKGDDGILTRFPNEEDGTPQTWKGGKWVTAGDVVGTKKREPADPNAPKPPTKTQLVGIEAKKATALRQSMQQFQKDMKEVNTGLSEDDADTVLRNHYERMSNAQHAYEQELSAANGNEIPHNDWADRRIEGIDQKPKAKKGPATTQPPPAAAPAASSSPAAQPKAATLDHVRAYAQQKGISEAQAVKEFKGAGYSIGQ